MYAQRFEVVHAGRCKGSLTALHDGETHTVGTGHDEHVAGFVQLLNRVRGQNARKLVGIQVTDVDEGFAVKRVRFQFSIYGPILSVARQICRTPEPELALCSELKVGDQCGLFKNRPVAGMGRRITFNCGGTRGRSEEVQDGVSHCPCGDIPLLHLIHKPEVNGGARRNRTDDLLHAMQALSQLSYGPEPGATGLPPPPAAFKSIYHRLRRRGRDRHHHHRHRYRSHHRHRPAGCRPRHPHRRRLR